jgi:hypothetical protein
MVPKKRKAKLHRTVLRLSDLDHSKAAVLNALTSPESRRTYGYAIEQFIAWYCSEPRLALSRIVVVRYRIHLEASGLAAVCYLAHEILEKTGIFAIFCYTNRTGENDLPATSLSLQGIFSGASISSPVSRTGSGEWSAITKRTHRESQLDY